MTTGEMQQSVIDAQIPLMQVRSYFTQVVQFPDYMAFLQLVCRFCPPRGTACEVGVNQGIASIWLSKQRYSAKGEGDNPFWVETARQTNDYLGGRATFSVQNDCNGLPYYDVIHHYNLLNTVPRDDIQTLLRAHLERGRHVVFSVSTDRHPKKNLMPTAAFLSLEEWTKILRPLNPLILGEYGSFFLQHGSQIMCVLPGSASVSGTRGIRQQDSGSIVSNSAAKSPTVRLRWEGFFWMHASLALVNREICRLLEPDPDIDLSIVETYPFEFNPVSDERLFKLAQRNFHPLSGPADVHVREVLPPRMTRVPEGKFVLMQPWEYGYLPLPWVERITQNVDEIWCNSNYVMDVYRNSGIPEDRLQLVPLAVDPDIFHPNVPPPDLDFVDEIVAATRDKFVFLFVGGTIKRKGFDVLLEAYLQAFTNRDDVVLLVKDYGTKRLYADNNLSRYARQASADTSSAAVFYLDDDMAPNQLAGIISLAHCAVHPYRAEGFCLPVIEAMACGVPALVTAGGSTDDFVDESVGWRIPSTKKGFSSRIEPYDRFAGPTWMFEVDVTQVARQMRAIYADPEDARKRGVTAAARVADQWTWNHTAKIIKERLIILRNAPKSVRGIATQWKPVTSQ